MKSWNTAVTCERHARELQRGQGLTVDLDRAGRRVVEAAQQLGQRGLAGAVLTDDGHRCAGRDRQVEAVEHGTAAVGVGE